MSDGLKILNRDQLSLWMAIRMQAGYSFLYHKGHVEGATYEDGTPEPSRNVRVECVQTKESCRILWG